MSGLNCASIPSKSAVGGFIKTVGAQGGAGEYLAAQIVIDIRSSD